MLIDKDTMERVLKDGEEVAASCNRVINGVEFSEILDRCIRSNACLQAAESTSPMLAAVVKMTVTEMSSSLIDELFGEQIKNHPLNNR